ncbi:MAG: RNA polymerase sigma-70 factor [Bacilli bacterium]|nr:RNA polymerase sigma-70 factor [Dysgonamonadaceae bacterium]MDD3309113.1 RNA polymerase sigma-70 factor [Dysgonamonadaceae bacterium]MDD3900884.1 RNA polymerase sigma-70 factor [Dysgonamonadaceae bacterium]MDD4398505.1 RNA polymerase sigma-70 factor [Dysgonamonadaceae bacterium]MEA5081224.1 RNA polymerase sigma-70 factor [Dysgonamonadaceae bacterium]
MENSFNKEITEHTFRKYYDLYFNELCKSLNYYTHDVNAIEDAVQEVFVKLWENRDEIQIDYIKTYLFTAARNRILNYLRDKKLHEDRLKNVLHEIKSTQGNDISINESRHKVIETAINTLPLKCKEIFKLKSEENLSYAQIADNKKVSIKTVENQIGIALKKIRLYIKENAVLSTLSFCVSLFI